MTSPHLPTTPKSRTTCEIFSRSHGLADLTGLKAMTRKTRQMINHSLQTIETLKDLTGLKAMTLKTKQMINHSLQTIETLADLMRLKAMTLKTNQMINHCL